MQASSDRRSNLQRTAEMRGRLIAAARSLFVERGYAATGTPEIVSAAGVTRGALYHHFEDKQALFRAVVEAEAAAVAAAIEAAAAAAADGSGIAGDGGNGGGFGAGGDANAGSGGTRGSGAGGSVASLGRASGSGSGGGDGEGAGAALARLLAGAAAYLAAMAVPGRTRLLLVEAPAVLGHEAMRAIDGGHAERTLREGLAEAMRAGALAPLPLAPLTAHLSAMFDRAALDAAAGDPPEATLRVIEALLTGLAPPPQCGAGG